MDIETKISIVNRRPTEEIITLEELKALFQVRTQPIAYDGFEASGIPHIATALLKVLKVKDITDVGCKHIFFLADWHSRINNKFGGDMDKITTACRLFVEVWKSLLDAFQVKLSSVDFVSGTQLYNQEYWSMVLRVAKKISLSRAKRALVIAGRSAFAVQDLASLFYIPMQIADIYHMGVDICQLGMDQRKANILAREIAREIRSQKPVCVHHHLLIGLDGPQRMGQEQDVASSKMSKSKPETCIYVNDIPDVIKAKLENAYCPPKNLSNNPVIDICRHIILRGVAGESLQVERPSKWGGPITFWNIQELEQAYLEGGLHPLDLKNAVSAKLSLMLESCRRHFQNNNEAKHLLETVEGYKVTR